VTDDELMRRSASGDEEAFRLLVERWQKPVLGFLDRMLGAQEEARDLAQETFLRLYLQAPRYQATGQFRSWLFRIAGNLARGRLRRRRILRWVPFETGVHDRQQSEDPPDRQLEREEAQATVQRALARLPDRQRQAVLMRRYADMSQAEIATALGTTIPGVESLLQRAMDALRRGLAREGGWP
jgi:RNA polymerase sigma-70 factor (ECF subfamily)